MPECFRSVFIGDLGEQGGGTIDEPVVLRRGTDSPLERAVLSAGRCTPVSASTHAKTLAALGLGVGARS